MKIFAISDLHLSFACDKPMDIFGGNWEGYTDKIRESWKSLVSDDDLVLIAGDISWAMRLEEVTEDLAWIDGLPGKKIIIKGNHEYWWKSISAVRQILPSSIMAIQNDCIKIGKFVFCGTRGWMIPERGKSLDAADKKIYDREVIRLGLTLEAAVRQREEGDKLILMMHYPPYNMSKDSNEFTDLIEKYKVDSVVFGHLHGKIKCNLTSEKNGIKYFFTSADHINMTPVLIYGDE